MPAAWLAWVGGALSVSAHPGHDILDHGAAHLVASPYHLAVLGLGGILLVAGAQFVRTQRPRLWLRIAGGTLVAATSVIWQLS